MALTSMNRRSFLRTAALTGAGLAALNAGVALADAPADAAPEADAAGESEGAAPAGGLPGAGSVEPGSMCTRDVDYVPAVGEYPVGVPQGTPTGLDWMAVPEPITDISDEKAADVIVVGAGITGLAAARAAAEEGASVIVIEATDTWQTRGQDIGTINSAYQKANGLECDADDINQVCLEMQKYTGNRANQALMRTWANRSGEDYDWWYKDLLEPAGYGIEIPRWPMTEQEYDPVDGEWIPQFAFQQEFTVPEGQEAGFNGGMPGAIDLLAQASIDLGAEFVFNTRARQLVRGEDNNTGRVTAVIAEDADGNYVKFNANKGVILATGDYGHNYDLMSVWCPMYADMARDRNVYSTTSNQGDGHLMGMWVGGMMQAIPHPHMAHGTPGDQGAYPGLLVDINGHRFTNEDIPGQNFSNSAELQPRMVWYLITDANYPNHLPMQQPGHGATMEFSGDLDAWNAAVATGDRATIEAEMEAQGISGNVAWSIEELAEAIHVDAAELEATITRYNEMCAQGRDDDFGKQAKHLWAVDTLPYFYSTSSWNFLVVMGGLETTTKAEVIDQFGNPIPGLYAAGNVQGGRFAVDYPTIVCGISHSICLTYGRIAGTECATCDPSVTEYKSIYKEWKESQAAETAAAADEAASVEYADGTYEASGKGIGGDVPVTVTVEGGKIASVEVGENSETQGIGSKAIEQLPEAIVAANGTTGVDAVSGASVTSSAIFTAVEDCLAQASK